MHFRKGPVPPFEAAERAKGLHDARPSRPATPRTPSESDDSDRARRERVFAQFAEARLYAQRRIEDPFCRNIFDSTGEWKTILSKPDLSGAQLCLDAFMLDRIEAILSEQRVQSIGSTVPSCVKWQKAVEKALGTTKRPSPTVPGRAKAFQIGSLAGR